MLEQLVNLAKLAAIDDSARELETQLREIPTRIEEMRADVAKLEDLLGRERRDLEEAEGLGKQQQADLAERNEGLARARAKGAKARTPKEAEAAEREVETNRRMIKDREDEIFKLEEALEKVRASVEQHEREFAEFRGIFLEEEAKAAVQVEALRAQHTAAIAGRHEIAAKIERVIMGRYDRVRAQRGSGCSIIATATCAGCRIAIQPQTFIELRRGEQMLQCHGCQRFLIYQDVAAGIVPPRADIPQTPEGSLPPR